MVKLQILNKSLKDQEALDPCFDLVRASFSTDTYRTGKLTW